MQIFTTMSYFPTLVEEIHSYNDSMVLQYAQAPKEPAFVAIGAGRFQNAYKSHQVDLYLIPLSEALDAKARAHDIAACTQHFLQGKKEVALKPYTQYFQLGDTEIAREARRIRGSKTFSTITRLLPTGDNYVLDELLEQELHQHNLECERTIRESDPQDMQSPKSIAVGAALFQDKRRHYITLYLLPYTQARNPQKRREAARELHEILERSKPYILMGTHGIAQEVAHIENALSEGRQR